MLLYFLPTVVPRMSIRVQTTSYGNIFTILAMDKVILC
jgi:hypothetical protein